MGHNGVDSYAVSMLASDKLRLCLFLLAGLAWAAVQANALASERTSPDEWPLDAWRLDDVTEIALGNRAEVSAAIARAEALAQRPAIVAALEDPMITPSIDHYPFDMPDEEGEMGEGDNGRRYDWSVSVEQRFPLSRVRGHRKAAAQADAQRARAMAYGTELDVVLDAQSNFFMLLERRRMQRVLDEQMILAQQVVSTSSTRYASGVGLQADVLRAEVEVARVQGTRQALSAQIRAAEAMLNVSLGRAPQERIPELVHVPNRNVPLPAEVAIERALLDRPELVAGEAEVKRATAEMEVMRSMYKPMAMIRVGRATTMAEGPGAMIMIGVSVPIWRDRLRAGVAEARAMQRMADADLTAMRRMVEGEAAAASAQVSAARSQLVVLEDEVMPRARAANEAALASYSSGQGTLVSVIESARALWDVQAEQVMAEAALGEAWARLSRAMAKAQERRP
jgi:cobalt-zinc-cadmium efflux system outer membrane protein